MLVLINSYTTQISDEGAIYILRMNEYIYKNHTKYRLIIRLGENDFELFRSYLCFRVSNHVLPYSDMHLTVS